MSVLALVGLAAAVFASTNIDDIFVLLVFMSDRRFKMRPVIVGQYLGIGLLVLISVVGALASLAIPPEWIGLLGLAPLAIGLRKLVDLRRSVEQDDVEDLGLRVGRSNVLAVAAVTIANGGDNLGVYIPLFATRSLLEVGVMVAVFLALVAVWLAAARYLLAHPRLGEWLRRNGHVLLPIVLIGLGLWILSSYLPLVFRPSPS
jgi:cadmium resistance protein CadD (predicted permease)